MSDDQDQGQGNTESKEVDTSKDNQETKNQSQSNEGQGEKGETESKQEKLYKTPDGRELNADQMYEEYGKLQPEFTRRSQKLSEYERKEREATEQANISAQRSVDEKLKSVPPDVRAAIVGIVDPVIKQALATEKQKESQRLRDEAFEKELSSLENKYPGGDGKPKFDRHTLIEAMRNPNNRNFDPESKFYELNRKSFTDWEIKQAMKGKSGGSATERTGQEGFKKPEGKTPRTFAEARQAAEARVR